MTASDPPEASGHPNELGGLRLLKALVIALTLTMIVAGLVVIWLMITRWPVPAAPADSFLPDTIELAPGATARAVTRGDGWWAVVVDTPEGQRIMIYAADGQLSQDVRVEEAP